MANQLAFAPNNNATGNIVVTGSNQRLTLSTSTQLAGAGAAAPSLRVTNVGANVVFLEIGAVGSTPTAAVATSMPLLPNTVEMFTAPAGGAVVAAIASVTGNTVYFTPGDGI